MPLISDNPFVGLATRARMLQCAVVAGGIFLLCRVGTCVCALPIERVDETMRPLPIEALGARDSLPEFVLGVSLVHGVPTPVVHAGKLLGRDASPPTRFVIVRLPARCVALAVDAVIGVSRLEAGDLGALVPMLVRTENEVASRLGAIDDELLLLLESARILSEDALRAIDQRLAAAAGPAP